MSIVFTTGCEFERATDGVIKVSWENGNALTAIRGASVDYVDPKWHMACSFQGNVPTYEPAKDLGRLLNSGVDAKKALVCVGMRRATLSIAQIRLNIAEIHTVTAADEDGKIPEKEWQDLVDNSRAVKALIDLGPTILGLNGVSLLAKGHHYNPDDNMWNRLQSATNMDDIAAKAGVVGYEDAFFHDVLHPFDVDQKAEWVSKADSPLVGHVNGVLTKRMPATPSGTVIMFVTVAALDEIMATRGGKAEVLADPLVIFRSATEAIKRDPLQWCSAFQRANTAKNLALVDLVRPFCAFVYGIAVVLFDRKSTLLRSVAFKNNASAHPSATSLGKAFADELGDAEATPMTIWTAFASLVQHLDSELHESAAERTVWDEPEDWADESDEKK
jgi:hypothetical protein